MTERRTHHNQYSRTLKITRMNTSKPGSPLKVPELLEQVLLHLTQGDILQLQRVSRFWLDAISGSPSLQQKLFFQPLPPSKAAGRLPEFNPIVKALFPFLFEPETMLFLRPWVFRDMAALTIQHWAGAPARRQAILRPEASWRLMLPVQPAAPIDGVLQSEWPRSFRNHRPEDTLEWLGVDPSRHGSALATRSDLGTNATMGLLYDIILHYFSNCAEATPIYVQWNMFNTFYRKEFELGDEKVKPRDTITIHVTPGHGYERERPVPKPGLGAVLGLPAGVLSASNKANRYPGGFYHRDYKVWGNLAPGLESELDREWRESRESRESEFLALHWETY